MSEGNNAEALRENEPGGSAQNILRERLATDGDVSADEVQQLMGRERSNSGVNLPIPRLPEMESQPSGNVTPMLAASESNNENNSSGDKLSNQQKFEAIKSKQDKKTIANAQPSFRWTWLVQIAISLLLLACAIWTDQHYSIEGFAFFALFILHAYAYCLFRGADYAIDMLDKRRAAVKNLLPRQIFKWLTLAVGILLALLLIVGKALVEYENYEEQQGAFSAQDLRRLKDSLEKWAPDFDSWWLLVKCVALLVIAAALFFVQQIEEEQCAKQDKDVREACKDIYLLGKTRVAAAPAASGDAVESAAQGQEPLLTLGQGEQSAPAQPQSNGKLPLMQGKVQECVLILKDYKLYQELMMAAQTILVCFIAASHYSAFTLVYFVIAVILFLLQVFSKATSDQQLRWASACLTGYFLVYFVAFDLIMHYCYRMSHDFDVIESGAAAPKVYQGIMVTTASLVAFHLKIALFLIECLKFGVSYDYAEVYDDLRDTYVNADSSRLPGSNELRDSPAEELRQGDSASPLTGRLTMTMQQRAKIEASNRRLKHKYVRHFHKSHSFFTRLMQPISLFMLALTQVIFLLGHGSVVFVVALGLVLLGFLVEARQHRDGTLEGEQGWNHYRIISQVLLCIEVLYVAVQFVINVFPPGEDYEKLRQEDELTVLLGIGTEQQTGYRREDDKTTIYESIFPFGLSVLQLLLIAVFIRYMGKPRATALSDMEQGGPASKRDYTRSHADEGQARDGASVARGHGAHDDDMLTVRTPDDGLSASGRSDLRSQWSRKSGSVKRFDSARSGHRFDKPAADSSRRPTDRKGKDLFRYIIQEMEDEEEDDDMMAVGAKQDPDEYQDRGQNLDPNDKGDGKSIRDDKSQRSQRLSPGKSKHSRENSVRGDDDDNRSVRSYYADGSQNTSRRSSRSQAHADDFTFRGQLRKFFFWVYKGFSSFFERVIDVLIVHVNKLVVLALFFVSVSRPTIVNFVLFIMFLVMLLIPYQHEKTYLRLTIILNSIAILLIYLVDVLNERDYAAYRVWTLYAIGVQYRSENELSGHLIKLKFLPYLILQVVLVLSLYVISSEKYERFTQYYTDLEVAHEESRRQWRGLGNRTALQKQRALISASLSQQESDKGGQPSEQPPASERGQNEESVDQFEGGDESINQEREQNDENKNQEEYDDQEQQDDDREEQPKEPDEQSPAVEEEKDDVTKDNLRKQQEVVLMYDPISKWILKNAAFLLVVFMFLEILFLPLSVMNIVLLVLMTVIVTKLLFNETKEASYRSLYMTLQVLNTFAIIYIFTKYLFLFTEYTKNIELKNKIENQYKYQPSRGQVNSPSESTTKKETEDAKSELHSQHAAQKQNPSIGDQLLQKILGFQKSEDERYEQGGSLLNLKLLNLAIVLSLTNLLLSALAHRQLGYMLGEKKLSHNMGTHQSEDGDEQLDGGAEDRNEERDALLEKVKAARLTWAWWRYLVAYVGYFIYFFMPFVVIIMSFVWYPLTNLSVPSGCMVAAMLIVLAVCSQRAFADVHRAIGLLVQIMMLVTYVVYFSLFDLSTEYATSKDDVSQQNLQVLAGVTQAGRWVFGDDSSPDGANAILIVIIPLFVVLCLCFLQLELEWWFTSTFNVVVPVNLEGDDEVQDLAGKIYEGEELLRQKRREQEEENLRRQVGGQLEAAGLADDKSKAASESALAKTQRDNVSEPAAVATDIASEKTQAPEGRPLAELEAELIDIVADRLRKSDVETLALCRADGREDLSRSPYLLRLLESHQNFVANSEAANSVNHSQGAAEVVSDNVFKSDSIQQTSKEGGSAAAGQSSVAERSSDMLLLSLEAEDPDCNCEHEQIDEATSRRRKIARLILELLAIEAPYRHCFYIRNIVWQRAVAHCSCVSLVCYFGIYACLNKMNCLAIIQWASLLWLQSRNFRPDIFKQVRRTGANAASDDASTHANVRHETTNYTAKYNRKAASNSEKSRGVVLAVSILIGVTSVLILVQLAATIYVGTQSSSQEDLQRSLSASFCAAPAPLATEDEYDDEGNIYQTASPLTQAGTQYNKECARDWSYYLFGMNAVAQTTEESRSTLLENQQSAFASIIIDFFFLLTCYLLLLVSSGQIKLAECQKYDVPVLNDKADFVKQDDLRQDEERSLRQAFVNFMRAVVHVYQPYFLIVYLLVASSTLNGHMVSDLLSAIYLWFGLVFIIRMRKLFVDNIKVLRPLRTYNRIVMTLILIYQMPLFLCPTSVDIQGYSDPDYVTTEDCALIMHRQAMNPSDLSSRKEAKSPAMQLYIILIHSIGLLKDNQVNMAFLFLFLFTELQQQYFQTPFYREYVLKHTLIEKESTGKIRAFFFVERFHLCRQWAYLQIKEEIKIMHKILMRLNAKVLSSDFVKNLEAFDEKQIDDMLAGAEDAGGKDDEERESLIQKEQPKESWEDRLDPLIDRVTLEALCRDKPIIPLKIVEGELKRSINEEFRDDKQGLYDLTKEELQQRVATLIKGKLEGYVFAKNRLDLYHKEGIGLAIALEESQRVGAAALQDIDSVQNHDDKDSNQEASPSQEEDAASQKTDKRQLEACKEAATALEHSRSRLYRQLHNFYLREQSEQIEKRKQIETDSNDKASEDLQVDRVDAQSAAEQEGEAFNTTAASLDVEDADFEARLKNETWTTAFGLRLRLFLWRHYVDHLLLIDLTKQKDSGNGGYNVRKPSVYDYGFFQLLVASIMTASKQIVFLTLAFNFIMNANVIALINVIANMAYAVLENPIAPTTFWKFIMAYMLAVVSIKFLYQLPIFCGTPVYTFYSDSCNNEDLIPQVLAHRVDYIIGVHKFSGPASYPKNGGIFFGLFADVLLLMAFLLHKQYLQKIGAWNYVKVEDNIYQNPSFTMEENGNYADYEDGRNANEQINALVAAHHATYVYEQSAWYEKLWINICAFFGGIGSFYLKLLPQYMPRKQPNLDARRRIEKPFKTHKMKRTKPGADYFIQVFFILLFIDIYTLIYWRNLSGEDKEQSFGAATVSLDRFSNLQVICLLSILLLLLAERMLSRARYVDERDHVGKVQSIATGANGEQQQRMRKSPIGIKHALTIKLIIYYTLLALVHICLGFIVPLYQLAPMYRNPWLCIYYLLWCLYFYYSALQLKEGYSMAPFKQGFSMRDVSFITQNAWRLYKALPFIWEMKVIIDWTVTSTCLDLYQWFKLDDAYNTLYSNEVQNDYRRRRPEFQQRALWEKLFMGFCTAVLLIFIILAPIFLFSGINPIMVNNPVKSGQLTIDLELIATGNSYRMFETQANHINPLTEVDDESWRLYFEPQSNQIDYKDMQKLQFNTYSESQWTISPPALRRFIQDFKLMSKDKANDAVMVNFKAKWTFLRDFPLSKEKVEGGKVIALTKLDLLPVIEMIERDNQLPQLGTSPSAATTLVQVAEDEIAAAPPVDDDSFVQLADDEPYEQLPFSYNSLTLAQSGTSMMDYYDDQQQQTFNPFYYPQATSGAQEPYQGSSDMGMMQQPMYAPPMMGIYGMQPENNQYGAADNVENNSNEVSSQNVVTIASQQSETSNQQEPKDKQVKEPSAKSTDKVDQRVPKKMLKLQKIEKKVIRPQAVGPHPGLQTTNSTTDQEQTQIKQQQTNKTVDVVVPAKEVVIESVASSGKTVAEEPKKPVNKNVQMVKLPVFKESEVAKRAVIPQRNVSVTANKTIVKEASKTKTVEATPVAPTVTNQTSVAAPEPPKVTTSQPNNEVVAPKNMTIVKRGNTTGDQPPLQPPIPDYQVDTPIIKKETKILEETTTPYNNASVVPPKARNTSQPVSSNSTSNITVTNSTTAGAKVVNSTDAEQVSDNDSSSKTPGAAGKKMKHLKRAQALIEVRDAFPKLLHLGAKDTAASLQVTAIANRSTSLYTSVDLQLNRQGGSIYYWTFTLGSGMATERGRNSSYLRDTPGVFNSRNTEADIEAENKAEHRRQSTSKIERRAREKDRLEMQRKRIVKEEQNLVVIIYNEHVIGSFFGTALQLSVLGLYVTFVIAIGRLIRALCDRISQRVMYEELPNTSQLFELCEGVFIAQQEGDLVREKQLYDLLILMYRSPEALIKITGHKLEYSPDDEEQDEKKDDGSRGSEGKDDAASAKPTPRADEKKEHQD